MFSYYKPKACYEPSFLPWHTSAPFHSQADFVPNGFPSAACAAPVPLVHERYRFRAKAETQADASVTPFATDNHTPAVNYSMPVAVGSALAQNYSVYSADAFWAQPPHVGALPTPLPVHTVHFTRHTHEPPVQLHYEQPTVKKPEIVLPECTRLPPPPLGVIPAAFTSSPPPIPQSTPKASKRHDKKAAFNRGRSYGRGRAKEKKALHSNTPRDPSHRHTTRPVATETPKKPLVKAPVKKPANTLLSGKTVLKGARSAKPISGDLLTIDATFATSENPPFWNRYPMRRAKLVYSERVAFPEGIMGNDPRYAVFCQRMRLRQQHSKVLYDSALDGAGSGAEYAKGETGSKRKSRFDVRPDIA